MTGVTTPKVSRTVKVVTRKSEPTGRRDGHDEPVVAVDQRELDEQQPDRSVGPGVDRAEVHGGVLELPEAVGGLAGIFHRGGQRRAQLNGCGRPRQSRVRPATASSRSTEYQSSVPSAYSSAVERSLAARGARGRGERVLLPARVPGLGGAGVDEHFVVPREPALERIERLGL